MKNLFREVWTSLMLTLVFAILLCGIYPVAVWGAGRILFPAKAGGSLVLDRDGAVRGSTLLAQNFAADKYFHPRPSAAGNGYDGLNSGGTNLGPTSAKLAQGVHAKDAAGKAVDDPGNFDGIADLVQAYRANNGLCSSDPVQADAFTRSASGHDPHISAENAGDQAARVARTRNLPLEKVRELIALNTEQRSWGVFGEAGVNVLRLNLALDGIGAPRGSPAK